MVSLDDWPSQVRIGSILAERNEVRDYFGDEYAEAYLHAAYVAESELSDGRGGELVHQAASEFCARLVERAKHRA